MYLYAVKAKPVSPMYFVRAHAEITIKPKLLT